MTNLWIGEIWSNNTFLRCWADFYWNAADFVWCWHIFRSSRWQHSNRI